MASRRHEYPSYPLSEHQVSHLAIALVISA